MTGWCPLCQGWFPVRWLDGGLPYHLFGRAMHGIRVEYLE